MKKLSLILCLLIVTNHAAEGQGSATKDRYKMAGSYIGIELGALNAFSGFTQNGTSPSFGFGRINIGGLHFWSKADFYISFPIATAPLSADNGFRYSEGIITGGRYIPFGLKRNRARPYIGANWTTPRWQVGDGPGQRADRLGLDAGFIGVVGKSTTIEVGIRYVVNQSQDYPLAIDRTEAITAPSWGVHIGLKKHVDFTSSYGTDAGRAYVAQNEKKFLENGAFSGWTIQAGLSATIALQRTDFGPEFVHLNDKASDIHPDLGVGHYFHKPKLSVNLAYRPVRNQGQAFGDEFTHTQHQIHAEVFKMLFDWNGFAPFAGIFGGITAQKFESTIPDAQELQETLPTCGIVMGWDIRPSDIDWYYLRTSLRYMPLPSFGGSIAKYSVPQLEINFIQFVFFPQRFKSQKS